MWPPLDRLKGLPRNSTGAGPSALLWGRGRFVRAQFGDGVDSYGGVRVRNLGAVPFAAWDGVDSFFTSLPKATLGAQAKAGPDHKRRRAQVANEGDFQASSETAPPHNCKTKRPRPQIDKRNGPVPKLKKGVR